VVRRRNKKKNTALLRTAVVFVVCSFKVNKNIAGLDNEGLENVGLENKKNWTVTDWTLMDGK